jgi:hypothetical protein
VKMKSNVGCPFCECGLPSALKSTSDLVPEKKALSYFGCVQLKCNFMQWTEDAFREAKKPKSESLIARSLSHGPRLSYQYVRQKKNEAFEFCVCKVCGFPCVSPLVNGPCPHFYCRACFPPSPETMPCAADGCIEVVSLQGCRMPDNTLLRLLSELEVYCSYKSAGCCWIGARGGVFLFVCVSVCV